MMIAVCTAVRGRNVVAASAKEFIPRNLQEAYNLILKPHPFAIIRLVYSELDGTLNDAKEAMFPCDVVN
jgi:hypothetical protein